MTPHAAVRVVVPVALVMLLVTSAATAITWRQSSDASWAPACDFAGRDIGSARVRGEDCSGACGRTQGCTHFAWTPHAGGTCWLKGRGATAAIRSSTAGAVCGIMKAAPVTVSTGDMRLRAVKYVPIYRFDDGAGSYCFPDDKRQAATRDGTCAAFRRDAPVFVSAYTCGIYTVYQFNLWYGQQKGCITEGIGGAHGDDNEYVQVWVNTLSRAVYRLRLNQHSGFYFAYPGGKNVEFVGTRPVVFIGKIAHGSYHDGCRYRPWPLKGVSCTGGCGYWSDFRNSTNRRFIMDKATLQHDPNPPAVECEAPECGHNNPDKRRSWVPGFATHEACSGLPWSPF